MGDRPGIPDRVRAAVAVPDVMASPPHPSVMSLGGTVQANDDGSITLWFGPDAPDGQRSNRVRAVTGKSWFTILRLYGPLQAWCDKTWRPGEIEPAT
jgi:hypothetical protein